jgi:hypothetical protein
MKGPKTMAKKPLGPEGARFKKADWNPQATSSKGTYISDRDALEARVAELEKVNGITVEVMTVKPEHLKGSGPYVVRYLVEDAQRIEHDFYKKADRALENLMRERVQAALENNDFGSLASLGKLPPVAVIKSADGECFVPMPTAGIVRPSLPDLSRVNEGDEIFKVQIDAELYDQEERAFAALGIAALEVAKSYRDAGQYTPERIKTLLTGADAVMKERDQLRDQVAKLKHRDTNFVPITSQRDFSIIAGAIGWIAAIGLYIYSDLPIPFVGGQSSETQISCANRLAGQNGAALPIPTQFTFVSERRVTSERDAWFAFGPTQSAPSDSVEITSIKFGPLNYGSAVGMVTAEVMNRSDRPIGQFSGAVEIAKINDNACQHESFHTFNDALGTVIQPGTSANVQLVLPQAIAEPTNDGAAVIWLNYQPISARPSER